MASPGPRIWGFVPPGTAKRGVGKGPVKATQCYESLLTSQKLCCNPTTICRVDVPSYEFNCCVPKIAKMSTRQRICASALAVPGSRWVMMKSTRNLVMITLSDHEYYATTHTLLGIYKRVSSRLAPMLLYTNYIPNRQNTTLALGRSHLKIIFVAAAVLTSRWSRPSSRSQSRLPC